MPGGRRGLDLESGRRSFSARAPAGGPLACKPTSVGGCTHASRKWTRRSTTGKPSGAGWTTGRRESGRAAGQWGDGIDVPTESSALQAHGPVLEPDILHESHRSRFRAELVNWFGVDEHHSPLENGKTVTVHKSGWSLTTGIMLR